MVLLQSVAIENDPDSGHILVLKKDSTRDLYSVLKTLSFRDHAVVAIVESGVKVIVDDMKCLQATVYLKHQLFSCYTLKTDEITFRIPLSVFCQCLNLFGSNPNSNTALKLTYSGLGEPLRLTMEEGGAVIDCSVHTQQADAVLDFEFDTKNLISRIIMKPEALRDVFADLDTSSNTVEIAVDIEPCRLRLITVGELGRIESELRSQSDAVDKLECQQKHSYKYRLMLIRRMSRALSLAHRVSLRTDFRGVLSVQFMIEYTDTNQVFIEFYCTPDDDEYDDV